VMIRRRALDWNPFCGVAVADISLKSLEKFCVHQKISGYCRKTKKEVADVIVAWTIKNQPAAMDTEEEQAAAAAATAKPLLVVPETHTQTDAVSDSTMEHIELNQQQPDAMKEVAECLASCRSITKSAALVYHPVVYLLQTNNSTRRKGWLRQAHGTTIAGCNAKELRVLNTLLLVLSAAMVPMTQEERRDLVAFAFNIATSRMKVYCTNFFTVGEPTVIETKKLTICDWTDGQTKRPAFLLKSDLFKSISCGITAKYQLNRSC
jgi:hypothetical protein